MIYSTSIFFNEVDLIDLKITEETPYVDKIFIIESPITFTGKPKPLNFPAEKYKGNKKVVYLATSEEVYKYCKTAWDREHVQRNYPQTVVPFNDDDVWFVTDADEILIGEKITNLSEQARNYGLIGLCMSSYKYFINSKWHEEWIHPFAANGKVCKKFTFDNLRNRRGINSRNIHECGKHLSYLGGPKAIEYKLKNFSHAEDGFITQQFLEEIMSHPDKVGNQFIAGLSVVDIDESYPKTILNNLSVWEKYIKR